jgi:hypothetical protein
MADQDPGGVVAVVAAGGCDGGVSGEFQGLDGEVPDVAISILRWAGAASITAASGRPHRPLQNP